MSTAGLIYGPEVHHLDHLAPLCSLLNIPLILTENDLVSLAQKFYPDLHVIYWPPFEAPEKLIHFFQRIIYSTPRVLFDEVFCFAQLLHQKKIETIWCPHGNSDKGRYSPFMEGLQEEETLLTYGLRMEKFLREKKIFGRMIRVGNYRLTYFERHKKFYRSFFSSSQSPIILYAPTWQDGEKNSSFPHIWPHLLEVPEEFSLFVKVHPHLYQQFPKEIAHLKKEGVQFIEDFPPIYPILSKIDLYMGDMSSIGYDVLAFKKPMILFSHSELTQVGRFVAPEDYDHLFDICKEELYKPVHSCPLYEETFDNTICLPQLAQDLLPI